MLNSRAYILYAVDIFARSLLDAAYGFAHFAGCCHGFFCKLAHFVCHNGKATARVASPCRLYGGIKGKQVCLVSNVGNDIHDLTDGFCLFAECSHILLDCQRFCVNGLDTLDRTGNNLHAFKGLLLGVARHFSCKLGVFGNLQHCGVHFFHSRCCFVDTA